MKKNEKEAKAWALTKTKCNTRLKTTQPKRMSHFTCKHLFFPNLRQVIPPVAYCKRR